MRCDSPPERPSPDRPVRQRGDALTSYALTLALIVVVSLGSMTLLERNGGEFLEETGTDIGSPRPYRDQVASGNSDAVGFSNSAGVTIQTTTTTQPPTTAATTTSTTATVPPSSVPSSTSTTTPTSSTAAPTPSSSTSTTVATTTTTTTPEPTAIALNMAFDGPHNYVNDPAGAEASGFGVTSSFVAPVDGTYIMEVEVLRSGDSAEDSVFVDIGSGLQVFALPQNIESPIWLEQSEPDSSGTVIRIEGFLSADQQFDFGFYPREPNTEIGQVRIVYVSP